MKRETHPPDRTELSARAWRLWGSPSEPTPLLPLRAGSLRLLFDPSNGFVRRLRWREHEVLRGIYAAVRDRNWGTVRPRVSGLVSQVSAEAFRLSFDVECRQDPIHFVWHGEIQGEADGTLHYLFDGEAKSDFLRNRIGLCVLHPLRECVGRPARQERTDGSVVEGRFPAGIEPQRVGQGTFRDLRSLAYRVASSAWAEVEFEGEVFELEDQRNWTDASFKTYGTPLTLPFPVEVQPGTRVRQRVTFRLREDRPTASTVRVAVGEEDSTPVTLSFPEGPSRPLPRIGLGMASHGDRLTEGEIERLRSLRLAHLRVDLRLREPGWTVVWQRAAYEAERLGVALELALHLPREGGVGPLCFQQQLRTVRVPVARVLALRDGEAASTQRTLSEVRALLRGWSAPVGVGSDANFCELNRERALGGVPLAEADFLFWSINPQVHVSDPFSIMETLEAQADTVRTAREFGPGKPLAISPVTLKPRFNAVATAAEEADPAGVLPASADPRQLSLFGAAWTLGSLATLTEVGVESVTFYETTGWRGVMERESGSSLPQQFPSLPGEVFPIFGLFSELAGCERFIPVVSRPSSRVAALAVGNTPESRRVLLGNLTAHTQHVRLSPPFGRMVPRLLTVEDVLRQHRKEAHPPTRMGSSPVAHGDDATLALPPYGLAVLDAEGTWRRVEDEGE